MSSLDEIKKKLNIEQMDINTRKEMFNKFVEKGGQVIKEKNDEHKPMKFNRHRQIELSQKIKQREEELKNKGAIVKDKNDKSQKKSKIINYPFSIFLKGFLNGYWTLSGQFHKNYINNICNEFNEIVSNLNFISTQIVKLENENRWKIIDAINKEKIFGFEIIMRFYDLYKIGIIGEIQKYVKENKNIKCTPILRNLHTLYQDLVILYPFWESSKQILYKATLYYEKLTKNNIYVNKNKIAKYIDRLFDYYLPFIHYTLVYNVGEIVPLEAKSMKEFAQISEENDIGVYTKQLEIEKKEYLENLKKEKEESLKKLQEEVEKKELEKIPQHVQKGLKLIDEIIEKRNILFKNDKNLDLFQPNEKMLYFYVIMQDFDKHYSFLMTTSQLKLTPRLESGERTDIRNEFDEEFIKYNEILNFIKEYIELIKESETVKISLQDAPVQKDKKLANINLKKIQVFNEIKARSQLLFKNFSNTLLKIINDYKGDKILLQNPEDLLSFPLSREKPRFDNVPIIKAIVAAYSFSSAIHYFITYDEFSHKSLFYENKYKNLEPLNIEVTKEQEQKNETNTDNNVTNSENANINNKNMNNNTTNSESPNLNNKNSTNKNNNSDNIVNDIKV